MEKTRKEKKHGYDRKYYAANPEKKREYSRKFRAANPVNARENNLKYNYSPLPNTTNCWRNKTVNVPSVVGCQVRSDFLLTTTTSLAEDVDFCAVNVIPGSGLSVTIQNNLNVQHSISEE